MGGVARRRGREAAMAAAALGIGLLLAAAAGELYVRAAWGTLMPMRVIKTYVQRGDAALGVVNRPGARFTLENKALGRVTFEANARGLRERKEVPYEKPAGERRLLALGDSFTYGQWVNEPETYVARVERVLGPPWEALNAGVMGWAVDQELAWLLSEGLRYGPDAVVEFFYVQNDFVPPEDVGETRFALGPEGALAPRRAGRANRRSRNPLLSLLVDRFDLPWFLAFKWNALKHTALASAEPPNPMLSPYRKDYPNDAERPGVDLTLAMLAEMRRASEAAGARFLLVTIDSHASQDGLWRAMLDHPDVRPEDYDRDHAEALLDAFAEREGMSILHLAPTLRARADEALFFETDPHFTALGHARAAEAVALRLRELGWTN